MGEFILVEARESLKVFLCDMAHRQRTELWAVLELESNSSTTKLICITLFDGIEVERLVRRWSGSGVRGCGVECVGVVRLRERVILCVS